MNSHKMTFTLDLEDDHVKALQTVLPRETEPDSSFAKEIKALTRCIDKCVEVVNDGVESIPEESQLKSYEIDICNQCIALEGEMCHSPGCVFCHQTVSEIKRILDICQIRMQIGDELHIADGYPLSMRLSPCTP